MNDYAEAARDVRLFLEGRRSDLAGSVEKRMQNASEDQRYEEAAGYRDLLRTLTEMEERQKIAAASVTTPTFWLVRRAAASCGEPFSLARRPRRRPPRFLLGELEEFDPAEFLPSL